MVSSKPHYRMYEACVMPYYLTKTMQSLLAKRYTLEILLLLIIFKYVSCP